MNNCCVMVSLVCLWELSALFMHTLRVMCVKVSYLAGVAHKPSKTNHNISTGELKYFTTHLCNISVEPKYFSITVTIFLHTKFTSTHLILHRTYPSLSGGQKFSPDSHFGTVNAKISPQNICF